MSKLQMSNFPLYDNLSSDIITNTDLSSKEKDDFMKIIKNVDSDAFELIYALIRTYQLENCDDKSTFKLPFGGKFVKNDIKFHLDDLPNNLKQIIYKFLLIHKKKIEEEELIEKSIRKKIKSKK
jgi:hypothetical protein